MKRLFLFIVFTATVMALSAQSSSLGIGIIGPNAVLHVHQNTYEIPAEPPLPGPPDGPRDGNFTFDYRNTFLMTNPNTGIYRYDGFLVEQFNYDVSLKQQEMGYMKFQTPGGSFMLTGTGRFGFGDTSSTHLFNVQGTARFGSAVTLAQSLTVGGNTTLSGSLAIGSGFFCDAQGYLKVKHLKVTLTDWPDYVFCGNRALMPLDELESYVNENNHLPGVPTAEEVERNGADLGEMNRLLMEKVEELTLYVIDLQKQIDELKSNR